MERRLTTTGSLAMVEDEIFNHGVLVFQFVRTIYPRGHPRTWKRKVFINQLPLRANLLPVLNEVNLRISVSLLPETPGKIVNTNKYREKRVLASPGSTRGFLPGIIQELGDLINDGMHRRGVGSDQVCVNGSSTPSVVICIHQRTVVLGDHVIYPVLCAVNSVARVGGIAKGILCVW
jgi:hypothetical protein